MIYTDIYIYVYMYVCMYIYIYICVHIYIYVYICIYIYIYVCMYRCIYIHACIHTYIHAYIHTYMHTYRHKCHPSHFLSIFHSNCIPIWFIPMGSYRSVLDSPGKSWVSLARALPQRSTWCCEEGWFCGASLDINEIGVSINRGTRK